MFKRFLMTIIVIGLIGLVGKYAYLELHEQAPQGENEQVRVQRGDFYGTRCLVAGEVA